MSAHSIAQKFRRALRNQTGATISVEQIQQLAEFGILDILAKIENQELWQPRIAPTPLATIGSPSGETENRPMSGKLAAIPRSRAPLSIEALSAGI